MLSAKDEKNAIGATLLYNISHYALRPWPWILIALASLVYFPMQLDPKPATPQVYVHEHAAAFLNDNLDAEVGMMIIKKTNSK